MERGRVTAQAQAVTEVAPAEVEMGRELALALELAFGSGMVPVVVVELRAPEMARVMAVDLA